MSGNTIKKCGIALCAILICVPKNFLPLSILEFRPLLGGWTVVKGKRKHLLQVYVYVYIYSLTPLQNKHI